MPSPQGAFFSVTGKPVVISTILGDSILRNLPDLDEGATTVCMPGARWSTIEQAIRHDMSCIRPSRPPKEWEIIVLQVGTNTIRCRQEDNQAACQSLVHAIRDRAPRALIGICTVLPRPRDMQETTPMVKRWNQWLLDQERDGSFMVINTYKTFTGKKGGAKSGFFADGLHLTPAGSRVLRDRIRTWLDSVKRDKMW